MQSDYRRSLSTVYNDMEILTCGQITEVYYRVYISLDNFIILSNLYNCYYYYYYRLSSRFFAFMRYRLSQQYIS